MNTTEAIEILTRHNQWRRGEDETINQLQPMEIGIAIERAVAVIEAAQTLLDTKGRHNTLIAYKALGSAMEGKE